MKKGQIYEGKVIDVDFPNKGIVECEEGKAIVKNVIPGQTVSFMVNKKKTHRIGEITTNKNGHTIKIIEYNNNKDMKVLVVETGEIKKASYYNFIRGKVNSACVTKNNSIK